MTSEGLHESITESSLRQAKWTSHPFVGEVSLDRFVHHPDIEIAVGLVGSEWPVNVSGLVDPVTGYIYAYVGFYPADYNLDEHHPQRPRAYESRDGGQTWIDRGDPLPPRIRFTGDSYDVTHCPDGHVTYYDGLYHMTFDWVHEGATWDELNRPAGSDVNRDSGVGYATSPHPHGPFLPTSIPVLRNSALNDHPIARKYRRAYASSLHRRGSDWLCLTIIDSQPYAGWGLTAMTSEDPTIGWSFPEAVLRSDQATFHHPMQEYFPTFESDGRIYAPSTSLGHNRNHLSLWSVDLEEAHGSPGWRLERAGSLWHGVSDPREAAGVWGQVPAFLRLGDSCLALHPSRTADGRGRISVATGPWPIGQQGKTGYMSAHAAPTLCKTTESHSWDRVTFHITARGPFSVFFGMNDFLGVIHEVGPGAARVDYSSFAGSVKLRFAGGAVSIGTDSEDHPGDEMDPREWHVEIRRSEMTEVLIDDVVVASVDSTVLPDGRIGLSAAPHSSLEIHSFDIQGDALLAQLRTGVSDGLFGAAQRPSDWSHLGNGMAESSSELAAVKWSFAGTPVSVQFGYGPENGRVAIFLDGVLIETEDTCAEKNRVQSWTFPSSASATAFHSVMIQRETGNMVVGSFGYIPHAAPDMRA